MAAKQFYGDDINPGDRLWIIGKGIATVQEIRVDTIIVNIGGRTRKFNMNGVASGDQHQTLFWYDPIVVQPRKGAHNWNAQKEILATTTRLLGDALASVAPIDDFDMSNLTPTEMFMRGLVTQKDLNESNLRYITDKLREEAAE